MTSTPVTNAIRDLVLPVVSGLQLDLYDLEFNGGILKITVDTPPGGEGGVTLDQLALITRLVGREFDHHDPIPGHYTLEVSSPGLERTLRTAAHFQREIGKTVSIRLRATVDGARRLQGVLVAADATTATVRLDDAALTEKVVAIDMIDRAKTVFEWEKGPKLGPNAPARRKTSAATSRPGDAAVGDAAPGEEPAAESGTADPASTAIGQTTAAKGASTRSSTTTSSTTTTGRGTTKSGTAKSGTTRSATTKRAAPKNSPKRDANAARTKNARVAAGGVKPPRGPSDELDPPSEGEATA
jgi:ribosome maturation factor RimP